MKKIFKSIVIVICLLLLTGCGNKKLEEIVDTFNSKGDMLAFSQYGVSINATTNKKNKIVITLTGDKIKTMELEYSVKKNILSGSFNTNTNNSFFIDLATIYLIDSICELNGYEKDEVLPSITDALIEKYTVENEGLLLRHNSGSLEVQMDINKKIPLVDFSKVYLEYEDVYYGKSDMLNSSFTTQRGNLMATIETKDGVTEITIGEYPEITDNSYKSLLTIIGVLFDDEKAIQFFKDNYSGISEGNKKFNGVNIELNYTITNNELRAYDLAGLKVTHVTINHKTFKKGIK